MKLTKKQLAFKSEYLKDLNGTQAAIRAGYSAKTAEVAASKLLSKGKVADAINEALRKRSERTEITSDYVLATIQETIERCKQARPVLTKTGAPVLVETADGDVVPAYTFDSNAVLKGCELLGRNLNIWKDVGSKENPMTIESLADSDLDARLAALEAKS